MRIARFAAPAKRELVAEVACYEAKEPRLGERFLAAVEATTARALAFSLTGTPASARTRRMFLGDFPFALVYRPDEMGIVIFALAHHARRPDYWRSRMDRR
ncbi:MAG: type II toxin-antitoxin system RelE/ParE family toxin [Cyanobacteriota bacterium]|nr:type II toxin-antitoxin system RelE/ParE family toxin [Cyanobacteriota bacterium]